MYKDFFAGMATELPLFAFALFALLFTLALFRVLVIKRRSDFDAVAAMPLQDDDTRRELHS